MDETQYLCKDCKHSFVYLIDQIFYLGRPPVISYTCRKSFIPAKVEFDPVLGNKKGKGEYSSCRYMRGSGCAGAKYWTPKHKKDLFKALTKERNV